MMKQLPSTKSLSSGLAAPRSTGGVSSTRELMRMTLEQSQQVLFHGLAFGNTDSISLDNYKSHTTTPSNEATQLNRFTNGSRNTLKQTMDR